MTARTYTVEKTAHVGVVYPNKALADIAKLLLDEWNLTPEQIANFCLDLPGECESINENRAEASWEDRSAPDDSSYRRDMVNAGRGHLLK